jgi:hypothetical protein
VYSGTTSRFEKRCASYANLSATNGAGAGLGVGAAVGAGDMTTGDADCGCSPPHPHNKNTGSRILGVLIWAALATYRYNNCAP